MGTWNAFYAKAAKDAVDATKIIIQREFPNVEFESKGEFLGVSLGEQAFEAPEMKLSMISARLNTEVIFLSFQSAVDAFQFYHWHGGDLVRRLVYGCFAEERTWEKVDGAAESWEADAFFQPKALERAIKYADDNAQKEELRRIWTDRSIEPGKTEPGLDAKSTAWVVATFYQLPHF